jgi:hypothetical protein
VQVARETVFGLDQRDVFLQAPGDVAQLHILTGLDAKQHLADEVSQGLLRPTVSSEVKQLSCAFSRERILLCCIGDAFT